MIRRPISMLAIAVAALACAGPAPDTGRVVHVADGDTVTVALRRGDVRVRLIGIDTPELHESEKLDRDAARSGASRTTIQALGGRARDAARALLLGKMVRLEYDVERRDRFGRDLAYVWLDDGTLANERLIQDGWASTYTFPPNVRYQARLRKAQTVARDAHRGIWAKTAAATPPPPVPRAPPSASTCPPERPLKANITTRRGRRTCIVHAPGDGSYDVTRPEQCYATLAEAEAAGCRAARR